MLKEVNVTNEEIINVEVPVGGVDKIHIDVQPVVGEFEGKTKVIIGDIFGK